MVPAQEADSKLLGNFLKRRLRYGDICQSFSETELIDIIKQSGNHAPSAILIMQHLIRDEGHCDTFQPPGYYKFRGNSQTLFFLPQELPHDHLEA